MHHKWYALFVMLMVTLYGNSNMLVDFEGTQYDFPDGTGDDEVASVLNSYVIEQSSAASALPTPDTAASTRTERVSYKPRESYLPQPEDGTEAVMPEMTELNDQQRQFADLIGEVETGGEESRSIRTKVKPTGDGAGSSAYGTYQITHGLLSGVVEGNSIGLNEAELSAAQELLDRQELALTIGGRDRAKYQKGGAKYGMAQKWAKTYGYETVEEFLTDFDYGGTLGLEDDADFQVLYESFARKLLNDTLKQAGGDVAKAAGIWHGGANTSKWGATTKQYQQKVAKLLGVNGGTN